MFKTQITAQPRKITFAQAWDQLCLVPKFISRLNSSTLYLDCVFSTTETRNHNEINVFLFKFQII